MSVSLAVFMDDQKQLFFIRPDLFQDLPVFGFQIFAVKEDIDDFVGDAPQFDDITMMAVKLR